MRNILNALYVCINGGFKLLVILVFIISNGLKGEVLFWTTTLVFTKVCSFSWEIAKAIKLSKNNNSNNNSNGIKRTLQISTFTIRKIELKK